MGKLGLRVLLLSFILCAGAASGSVRHVAVTGDDVAGDGSASRPLRTITVALSSGLVEGEVVVVGPGAYDAAGGETLPLVVPRGVALLGS